MAIVTSSTPAKVLTGYEVRRDSFTGKKGEAVENIVLAREGAKAGMGHRADTWARVFMTGRDGESILGALFGVAYQEATHEDAPKMRKAAQDFLTIFRKYEDGLEYAPVPQGDTVEVAKKEFEDGGVSYRVQLRNNYSKGHTAESWGKLFTMNSKGQAILADLFDTVSSDVDDDTLALMRAGVRAFSREYAAWEKDLLGSTNVVPIPEPTPPAVAEAKADGEFSLADVLTVLKETEDLEQLEVASEFIRQALAILAERTGSVADIIKDHIPTTPKAGLKLKM
jgi:hypothetical protein